MSEDAASQHVIRTVRALELLAEGAQTQASIARHLGVHRRTARRLLGRLVDLGYVESADTSDPNGFAATTKIIQLAQLVANRLDVVQMAPEYLGLIRDSAVTGRMLARLKDGEVQIHVVEAGGHGPAWLGQATQSAPLHATAVGKAFLANDTMLLEEVLAHELPAFTGRTLTKRADLLLELSTARRAGYTVELGEFDPDQFAVGAQVYDHTGQVVGAIAVLTADADAAPRLGRQVHAAADEFSAALGGQVHRPIDAL